MPSPCIYDQATRLGPPPPVHLTPRGIPITAGRLALSIEQLARIDPFHIDGFAGGGGASEGYYLATGRHTNMAWNHDREAVAMHRANHPFTKHFIEDIRKVEWKSVIKVLVTSAWFSPDCKDFSKAKGGKPKSKRIRGLAWTIIHMIDQLGPYAPLWLFLENVEEFADWCQLLPDGTRNPKLLGYFMKCFTGALYRRGYENLEWAVGDGYVYRRTWSGIERRKDRSFTGRACDYSRAPTIRKRLYLIGNRVGQPIILPEHLFGEGKPRRSGRAADILDFNRPCPSIFMTRRQARAYSRRTGIKIQRPLKWNSMQRFADGVDRYAMRDKEPFLVCLTHEGNDGVEGLGNPVKTVTGAHRGEFSFATPFLARQQHGGGSSSSKDPAHTVTASPKDQNQMAVVHVAKITSGGVGSAANEAFPTITANSYKKRPGGNPPLGVVATFLAQNNGGMVGHRVAEAVSTINGKGANQSLVSVGLAAYFESLQDARLEEGMHTVTTKDRFALWAAELGIPELTPALAKKARRVARWLRRHGVKVEGEFAMCGEFVIVDIGMRMLTARELYLAQGFGEDYIIDFGFEEDGTRVEFTKTAKVKMCGNSVCPPMAEILFRLNLPAEHLMKEAA